MKNLWRVAIIALLAGAVVFTINLKGARNEPPADTAAVTQESAVAPVAEPAAEKQDAAEPDSVESKPASDVEAPAKKPVEADKPAAGPEKKPESAKPVKAADKPGMLPRIVDVGGENCIPCKLMIPVLEELRSEYKGKLTVTVIDQQKDPDAAKKYRVTTIPTQILYDTEGKEIARHFGFFAKDEIIATFEKHGIKL